MVTAGGPERMPWLSAALAGYCQQRYPNRELVIVMDNPRSDSRARLERKLERCRVPNARLVCPPRKMTLGALRNLAMDHSRGEILCVWDDDDVHPPDRIALQLRHLQRTGSNGVLLGDCLHLFMQDGRCYWVNWTRTRYGGLPGSLMIRKDTHDVRYAESGGSSRSGEDTDFLDRLAGEARIALLRAPPFLYVYRFHGTNTFNLAHHAGLAARFCEPRGRLVEQRAALIDSLSGLDLGLTHLTMFDGAGGVFRLPAGVIT
jgi:glycosyltransferase involved in cell wall biosynthesis